MAGLYESFNEGFKINREKVLIKSGSKRYTGAEIDAHVAKIANELAALSIKKGDRVALQVNKSVENLLIYLACLRCGVIYLPLNPDYTLEEVKYFIANANPTLVIADPSKIPLLEQLKKESSSNFKIYSLSDSGQGSFIENVNKRSEEFQEINIEPKDIAAILYTSGTTGKPKGAMITHGGLLHNAKALNAAWAINDKDVILHALPLFHVHGLFFACHTAFLSGATLIFLPKFEIESVIEKLPESTIFMGVPTYYTRLLSSPKFTKEISEKCRLFISGSAPLLKATFQAFKERTGHDLVERYGMTETGINTTNPIDGFVKLSTVGKPLSGVELKIVDNNDIELPAESVGHIQIKGAHLFKGYWEMSEKTAEAFTKEGFFRTGDMGILDDDGYLSIVGRDKDMVITGGLNVYPKECELVINELEADIIESSVIGIPHPDFGEAVVAIVVRKPESTISEVAIQMHLATKLANYKCPKKIFFAAHLPKNTMGKVQKNVLRDRYKAAFEV